MKESDHDYPDLARLDDIAECALVPGAIADGDLSGNRAARRDRVSGNFLLRRDIGDEVEFSTIMWFDSIEAVKVFAGEEHEVAVVPPKARTVLSRYEHIAMHYETVVAPPFLRP